MTHNATCPRCGAVFHCAARDETPCDCRTVQLGASTLQWLHERYTGCLCPSCLRSLSAAAASAPTEASSPDTSQ
ncbi:MAG: cysteine-rich CWC family protein [Burkholderiales bacterium]|nr:MAG: cysteine-rich CWC family protein [Burkholderiales bacterium]